jgi:uncharacterized membrane-anchored protein YhcB (DUF1043 family)
MEEFSIYSLVVIIIVFVLICIAIIYVFLRFSNNSYNQKLQDMTSQINDSQVSTNKFQNTKNNTLLNDADVLDVTTKNVKDLTQSYKDINDNLSQYGKTYYNYIQNNDQDMVMIEQELPKDIKKQVDNIEMLKSQRDIYNTNISNLNNTNVLQNMSIIDINLKNQSANKSINNIIDTWKTYDNTSTKQFNNINANYMKTTNFNDTIKNYKTKNLVNDALTKINTSIAAENKILQTYPSTYASTKLLSDMNDDTNTASGNIQTQSSILNTIKSSYATKQDIINAQTINNSDNTHINNLLTNLSSSLTKLSTAIAALNNTYQPTNSLTAIQTGNLTGNKLCLQDNTCITKNDFQKIILMPV